MSKSVEINGSILVTSKEAAKSAGYSADYITRLARESKVVGTQIDRQWFIEPKSLQSFLEAAKIEKLARKKQLQAERAKEQLIKHEHSKTQRIAQKTAAKQNFGLAVQSAALMLVGIVAGTLIYNSLPALENSFLSDQRNVAQVPEPLINSEATQFKSDVVFKDREERIFDLDSGIVLFQTDASATVTSAAASFSDPVVVAVATTTNSGFITYGEGAHKKEFPFVLIPR